MYSLADANIYRGGRRVRRLSGHRQSGVERSGLQARVQYRHREFDQLGPHLGADRLLRQGLLAATTSNSQKVSFAVPSGNFGNILAGHLAREMGLPIDTLALATNENNVLAEFFNTGVYRPRPSSQT